MQRKEDKKGKKLNTNEPIWKHPNNNKKCLVRQECTHYNKQPGCDYEFRGRKNIYIYI